MARDLSITELLGALVATENLTLEDTVAITEYAAHVSVQHEVPAESLEAALDMALDFFNEDPDTEAAKVEAAKAAPTECDHDHCKTCGAPIEEDFLTEQDFDMAVELWVQVRDMVRFRDGVGGRPDQEEC